MRKGTLESLSTENHISAIAAAAESNAVICCQCLSKSDLWVTLLSR